MVEYARKLDEAEIASAATSGEGQLVVFRLADEEFGVNIDMVKEIVRVPEITPMPRSPEYVAGICNLRGSILPVIDSRIRFSMPRGEQSDHTRLLVIDLDGVYIGLIVDAMREVMRMSQTLVEPPPAVCEGVDRQFLDGVVKMDEGRRLVLMLNMREVVAIKAESEPAANTGGGAFGARKGTDPVQSELAEEEHLVSFNLAGEEYAFDIAKVREILKVPLITAVPNVPEYVKGLFTIRNQLLPIIDLRRMLFLPELVTEYHQVIDWAIEEQQHHEGKVLNALDLGRQSISLTDPAKTAFGAWLSRYDTSSVEIEQSVKKLQKQLEQFNLGAIEAMEGRGSAGDNSTSDHSKSIRPLSKNVLEAMNSFKQTIAEHHIEDQRVMVVESSGLFVGYLVDSVNEVVRIPKSYIDDTPTMAASQRKEVKSVARLDDGERLVMIMDEMSLITNEAGLAIKKIKDDHDKSGSENMNGISKTSNQQNIEEEQLVTFGIADQEYGVPIMQVKEINRVDDITVVPRAPYFVDGVTNLRGHVIPVIDVRSLFGLKTKEIDDRTRVIIVDIGGAKTGLRVDNVNEVLRLARSDIEKTPSIITASGANKFMVGVCKIQDGRRMITLLDMEKILDEKETSQLSAMGGPQQSQESDDVLEDNRLDTDELLESKTDEAVTESLQEEQV